MKKLLFAALFGLSGYAPFAQAPAQINYQGVARNSVGSIIADQKISLRLTIRDNATGGAILYQETRNLRTNSFGLFTTAIGSAGSVASRGIFSEVDWARGSKFLQVEIDPNGGTDFINMGTSQLLSVPYALFAGSAAPTGKAGGDLQGAFPQSGVSQWRGWLFKAGRWCRRHSKVAKWFYYSGKAGARCYPDHGYARR
jgi:hypothetical protein